MCYLYGSTTAFTLMELVLVIAVLGIIASLGVGSYENFLRQSSLGTEVNEIITTLRDAQNRSQASSEGFSWGVQFDDMNQGANANRVILFKGNCSNDATLSCRTSSDCAGNACTLTDVETRFLSSFVEISAVSFGAGSYTVFDRPTGKPKSGKNGSVTLQLKGGGSAQSITVSTVGKIE